MKPVMEIFASNFQKLFSETGLSQDAMGRKIGASQSSVGRMLAGQNCVLEKIESVSEYFKIPAWKLLLEDMDVKNAHTEELAGKNAPVNHLPPTFNNDTIYEILQLDEDSYKLLESMVADYLVSDNEARASSQLLVAGQLALSKHRGGAAEAEDRKKRLKGFKRASITRKEES